jgi:hypothetical protein
MYFGVKEQLASRTDEIANHIKPLELIHLTLLNSNGFNVEAIMLYLIDQLFC